MALPLQPNLKPAPYWYRRLLVLLGLLLLIVVFGSLQARHSSSRVQVLDNQQRAYLATVSDLLRQSDERIWCMLYVMRSDSQPGHPVAYLMQQLADARARGVDVRVILDRSDPQAKWPGPDNSEAARWLRQQDIIVYEDELDTTTHGKVLLIDDCVVIGSHNWTSWALTRNREISMLSYQAHSVDETAALFNNIFNTISGR